MNHFKTFTIVYTLLTLIILTTTGIGYYFYDKATKETEIYKNLHKSLNDSLTFYVNENNELVGKISVIETNTTSQFLDIQTTNETVKQLQNLVKEFQKELKKGGNATIIEGNTTINQNSYTTIKDSCYFSTFNDEWIDYTVKACFDTTNLKLKVNNSYSLVVGFEKEKGLKNIFKKPIPYSFVKNQNPYSSVTEMKTYQVTSPKQKRLGIGFNIGASLNSKGTLAPAVSGGLNYTLIYL